MLLQQIKDDIISSLKAGRQVRLSTLRFLLSAVRYAAIAKYGADGEAKLTDTDVLDVVKKQVKTHRESIDAFDKGGRPELVAKEKAELEILQGFLPAALTDEELAGLLLPVAISGETNFGLLMKQAMSVVSGRADGARVSAVLKKLQSANN